MHEMGIVYGLFDTISDILKQNSIASPIESITLEVGEASMVVDSYLKDCFDMAKGDVPALKDCVLVIHDVTAEGRCNACGKSFPIKENDRVCPHCGKKDDFVTISGMDLNLSEIAVKKE